MCIRDSKEGMNVVPEIMIPLAGELKELKYVKDIITETADKEIANAGVELEYHVGTMIEIPRAALTADEIATELSLIHISSTSMGGRLLRRWLNDPLVDECHINRRLESVKELKEDIILRGDIVDSLKKVYDIERLASKISYGSANGRDLISLKNSTAQLPGIKTILSKAKSQMLKDLYGELDELQDIYAIIDLSLIHI